MLVRHSVRDELPPGDAGYVLPITDVGRRLACELGTVLRGRLRSVHSSPLMRCLQTGEALVEGAGARCSVVPSRLLGDPGGFVLDDRQAWTHWESIGHEGVMRHLVSEHAALSGMARPDEAARYLVQSMLAATEGRAGVHVFVTHDSLVTATAARVLGIPLGVDAWPWYLEAAFFWSEDDGVHVVYREHESVRAAPLCSLVSDDVIELARREVAATLGLDVPARFFLAGGAFKSLLTGRPPRDLDLWAPSERDRALLIDALIARGAHVAPPAPFADVFEIAGRVVEVPHRAEPDSLDPRLARFDLALSAVGVEHHAGRWSARIHPLAVESVERREVRLLEPLVNWKYALATLERMRRYARELDFRVPEEEEAEVWRIFEAQDADLREAMIERCRRAGVGGFGVIEEAQRRCA